jgi:hypothetical protein
MPIEYSRDDRNKRAVIVITGPFNAEELVEMVEQHRAAGGWTYGLLYDMRRMTGEPTMETLREFAAITDRRPGEPPRGPVAVLTTDPAIYSRACTYAVMAKAHATIEVFRDKAEADAWLRRKTSL